MCLYTSVNKMFRFLDSRDGANLESEKITPINRWYSRKISNILAFNKKTFKLGILCLKSLSKVKEERHYEKGRDIKKNLYLKE